VTYHPIVEISPQLFESITSVVQSAEAGEMDAKELGTTLVSLIMQMDITHNIS